MFDNKYMKNKFNAVSPTIRDTKVKAAPQSKEPLTIRCTCGAKILIVPDIAAMNLAIQKHKAEHKEADEGFLVQQILETLAKRKK
ncbi:MAG: hypothetical protein NWE95_07530 [Candidatus Bathyarchaeota archaeon]|jgi:hypothetical protein|nr:hypothetical protein [Candidatus Bathyarchaeota archaeon]